jgi:hypothetical protein
MKAEAQQFLNLHRLPGRITAEEASCLLGVQKENIPILIAAKLLKPLGGKDISVNAPKMFASFEVEPLARDVMLLQKAHDLITRFNRTKNKTRLSNGNDTALP